MHNIITLKSFIFYKIKIFEKKTLTKPPPNRHAKVINTRYNLKKSYCVSAGSTWPLLKTPGVNNGNREAFIMKKVLATALVLCSLFYSLQAKAASSLAHATGLFTYPAKISPSLSQSSSSLLCRNQIQYAEFY